MRTLLCLLLSLCLLGGALAAPPDWSTEKKKGDQALKRKDYPAAIRIFEILTRAYPEKVEGFNALGFSYFMAGDHERAFYAFKQALSLSPGHASAQHNLILAATEIAFEQCRSLEFTEAVNLLRNILSAYPNHPEAAHVYFLLGKVEFFRGDEAEAIGFWREVGRRVPQSGTARFLAGYDLEQNGDLAGAGEAYQQAVKKLPDEPIFRNYYGMLLARRGKLDQGLAQLRTGLKDKNLPYIDLRVNTARLLLQSGQREAASETLREALTLRPDYGSLYLWEYALASDPESARRALALAVARDNRAPLVVASETSGALAYVDDRPIGPCPTALFVPAGKHKVKVRAGQDEQVLWVEAAGGSVSRVGGGVGSLVVTQEPVATSGLEAAPDFILKDRSNRRWRIIQHLHKRPIVLLFWRAETGQDQLVEDLSGLCDRYEVEGAAIHSDPARRKAAQTALLSMPANFAGLFDDGDVAKWYQATEPPLVVVIDVDGFIAARSPDIWSLEPQIRRMLGLPGDRP